MADAARRKRKWDVAAPDAAAPAAPNPPAPSPPPPAPPSNQDPALTATLAAKRLNAMLAQSGVANILAFEKEVEINHCRPETRYYLCRGTTHDEISEKTGVTIKVKGRFKPPGDNSAERPLHLWIGGNSKESVDIAVDRVYEIIRNDQARQSSVQQTVQFIAKVFVGMEGTDANYDVIARVTGPNNSYLEHIQNASKAQVTLRGVGSGWKEGGLTPDGLKESMEPLHLFINAKNKMGLDNAKSLCENLCSTLRTEYYQWVQQRQAYSQQGYQQYYGGYGQTDPAYAAYYGAQAYGGYPYGAYPGQAQGTAAQAPQAAAYSYPYPNAPAQAATPTSPTGGRPASEQPRRFQEKKVNADHQDVPGPRLPSKDEEYSFYSEIDQMDKSYKPGGTATPSKDLYDGYQG